MLRFVSGTLWSERACGVPRCKNRAVVPKFEFCVMSREAISVLLRVRPLLADEKGCIPIITALSDGCSVRVEQPEASVATGTTAVQRTPSRPKSAPTTPKSAARSAGKSQTM
jgi:hypothetical protein